METLLNQLDSTSFRRPLQIDEDEILETNDESENIQKIVIDFSKLSKQDQSRQATQQKAATAPTQQTPPPRQ